MIYVEAAATTTTCGSLEMGESNSSRQLFNLTLMTIHLQLFLKIHLVMIPQGEVAPEQSIEYCNIIYTDKYLPICGTLVAKDYGRHITMVYEFISMEVFKPFYIFDSDTRNEESMRVKP